MATVQGTSVPTRRRKARLRAALSILACAQTVFRRSCQSVVSENGDAYTWAALLAESFFSPSGADAR